MQCLIQTSVDASLARLLTDIIFNIYPKSQWHLVVLKKTGSITERVILLPFFRGKKVDCFPSKNVFQKTTMKEQLKLGYLRLAIENDDSSLLRSLLQEEEVDVNYAFK